MRERGGLHPGSVSFVPCPLRAAALASPGGAALVGRSGVVSYAELDRRVSATEGRLGGLGVRPGTRVALYLPKDERYVELLLALIRTGAVACPVSTRLPVRGVATLLKKAGCSALISDDGELLRTVGADCRRLRPGPLLGQDSRPSGPSGPREVPPDRPATVIFTSGSTGVPKAALHDFGSHYYSALGSNANIALSPGDRWLHSLPLYHVGGLSILFRCLLAGATIALPEPGASLGGSISALGATHVSLVATQLLRLLRENADPGGLKAILLGGGPIPPYLVDEAVDRGLPIHTSYGLTEMASQVTTTPPGASRRELYTAGRALPHREVSVSEDGEILVRGATLFAGYLEGEEPDRPVDADGWFHTGDLGEWDEKGYLRVRGRRDNLFVSGGENVQPEEVEDALRRLEDVEEAVVVPVPDAEFGARPVAFVRTVGGDAEPEELARALAPVLPRFKIPVAFHEWPEGVQDMKVNRIALAERARRLDGRGRR